MDRYMGQASVSAPRADPTPQPSRAQGVPSIGPGRTSKYDPVWMWLDEAGTDGLATEEIAKRLAVEGTDIKRSSLRAFLWNQKEVGRLIHRNGRYVAAKYQDTGEREGDASNSPDLLEGTV